MKWGKVLEEGGKDLKQQGQRVKEYTVLRTHLWSVTMNLKWNQLSWLREFLQQWAAVDRIIAANLIEYLACVRHCVNHFTRVTSLNVLNNYEIGSSAGFTKSAYSYYCS